MKLDVNKEDTEDKQQVYQRSEEDYLKNLRKSLNMVREMIENAKKELISSHSNRMNGFLSHQTH